VLTTHGSGTRKWSIQSDLPNEPDWQNANAVSNQRTLCDSPARAENDVAKSAHQG
jgi:hypothetical protein